MKPNLKTNRKTWDVQKLSPVTVVSTRTASKEVQRGYYRQNEPHSKHRNPSIIWTACGEVVRITRESNRRGEIPGKGDVQKIITQCRT